MPSTQHWSSECNNGIAETWFVCGVGSRAKAPNMRVMTAHMFVHFHTAHAKLSNLPAFLAFGRHFSFSSIDQNTVQSVVLP